MKTRMPLLATAALLTLACGGGEVSSGDGDAAADSKAAATALCGCMEEERPAVNEALAEVKPEEKELMTTYMWGLKFTKCQIFTRKGESDVAHPAFKEGLMATCPEFEPQLTATVSGSELGGAMDPLTGKQ